MQVNISIFTTDVWKYIYYVFEHMYASKNMLLLQYASKYVYVIKFINLFSFY